MNATPSLRPMTIGDMFDAAFRLYREHFLTFIGIVALLQVPMAIVQFAAQVLLGNPAQVKWLRAAAQPQNLAPSALLDLLPEYLTSIALVAGVNIVIALFGQTLMTGALANAIARSYLGRPAPILQAYRLGVPRYTALILASLLVTAALLGVVALLGGCVAGVLTAYPARQRSAALIGGLFIGAFGALLVVVPLFIFITVRLLFTTQAIVLEGHGAVGGLRRSWNLVRGSFWRTLGIIFLLNILISVLAGMPAAAVSFGLNLAGDPIRNLTRNQAITVFLTQIGTILATPIALSIYTLLYYDLRVRKEGYDIEMLAQQAVQS